MSKEINIKPGVLLVVEPFLPDPNFSRSVVFVVEHNEDGTIGFVLNQPLNVHLTDVLKLEKNPDFDIPIYQGGPVEPNTLHVLHQLGDHIEGAKRITKHIYWGGDFEQIKFLIANKNANWRDFRFFIGYSGWGKGQLTHELNEKSWIAHKANVDYLFTQETDEIWENAIKEKGGKFKLMAKSPLRPDWN